MANVRVSFSKKRTEQYDPETRVPGRVYFVEDDPDNSTEIGKIFMDGKRWGGEQNNLSDAAAAWVQAQYNANQAAEAQRQVDSKFSVTTTTSDNRTILLAGTTVSYTIDVKFNGSYVQPTSGVPSAFQNTSTGKYTLTYNNVATIPALSGTVKYKDPSTQLTTTGVGVNFPKKDFYLPIIYGTVYDNGGTPPGNFVMNTDHHEGDTGENFTWSLNRCTTAYNSYASFKATMTVHKEGARIVVMIPKATGTSNAVSGHNSAVFEIIDRDNDSKLEFKPYTGWSVPNYAVFVFDSLQIQGSVVNLGK